MRLFIHLFCLILDECGQHLFYSYGKKKKKKNIVLFMQVIPRQLCDNAGFDATDVLNKLRQKHALPSGQFLIQFSRLSMHNVLLLIY